MPSLANAAKLRARRSKPGLFFADHGASSRPAGSRTRRFTVGGLLAVCAATRETHRTIFEMRRISVYRTFVFSTLT